MMLVNCTSWAEEHKSLGGYVRMATGRVKLGRKV